MSALIKVDKITKGYGTFKAVDSVSFEVNRGEIVGFLGPNGAGKSTTMKMISGFLTPDHGDIFIDGKNIESNHKLFKSKLGYLPEGTPFYTEMSVYDFLHFIASVKGLDKKTRKENISIISKQLNISDVLHRTIDSLSKGYKRRVGLAYTLINNPDILILDEPSDGLDPNQKLELRTLIRSIAVNKAILISTHNLEEVEAICDRVILITEGKISLDVNLKELFKNFNNCVQLVLEHMIEVDVKNEMQKISGLKKYEIFSNEKNTFTKVDIYYDNMHNIIKLLGEIVLNRNWKITSFSTQANKLETIFREITLKQNNIMSET